jgi:hypothetical protein
MKLLNFVEAMNALDKVALQELEAKDAYWIEKESRHIINEFERIEKLRNKMIEKYGTKQKDGVTKVDKKNIEVFRKEYNELLDQDIKFDNKIKLEHFKDVKLSTLDMKSLEPFIQE